MIENNIQRCDWVSNDEDCINYHDNEWGKPQHDDKKLFEFIILEGFQAGLSWKTILKKRENFRKAFDEFDYQKIALYDDSKRAELKEDAGIIRNRLKIASATINAKAFIEIQKEFGSFDKYIWNFVDNKPINNKGLKSYKDAPTTTDTSDKISKDLKERGFKFVGSTIVYAFMQAVGMVNDHSDDCFCKV
jgi:DNA-3-methyladenine glycosylase I